MIELCDEVLDMEGVEIVVFDVLYEVCEWICWFVKYLFVLVLVEVVVYDDVCVW